MKRLVLFAILVYRARCSFLERNSPQRHPFVEIPLRTSGRVSEISSSFHHMVLSDGTIVLISYIPPMKKPTELWLDLRGTATHPQAALQYILDELEDDALLLPSDRECLIDKVIVTDRSFQSLVSSSDPFVGSAEILYEPDGTSNGYVALSRNGLSLPFGSVLLMPSDSAIAVSHPLDAMRMIGDSRWILLENEARGADPDKETLRLDAIASFLDLAATTSAGKWGISAGQDDGEDLQLIFKGDVPVTQEQPIRGGVAVSCSTKSFLIQLASVLESFQSASSATTTDSGIIIHSLSDVLSPSLPTAMILPFDMSIWKAAAMMYGHSQFQNLIEGE